ncbi:MAG: hypothetical protein LC114_27250 [Bryobacterales bacterium]|nr:hypothetical protein [Bryobacterales bacterium]
MMLALLLAAVSAFSLNDCVPARWPSADSRSLELFADSPINCLIVEEAAWNPAFIRMAHKRQIHVLADISRTPDNAAKALAAGVDGLYLEGDLPADKVARARELSSDGGKPFAWLPSRSRMPIHRGAPNSSTVLGSAQGLWAGVKLGHEGEAEAAPSGPPWIDTNSGFLRFVRAEAPRGTPVWIANRPPDGQAVTAERYIQAIGDAAMAGAHWVVTLDTALSRDLFAAEPKALKTWARINGVLRFYQQNRDLSDLPDYSKLAIVQDAASGALVSGSVLDMVSSKHVPAFVATPDSLGVTSLPEVKLLLNIDPKSLNETQTQALRMEARKGAMLMNGPPQWKLALPPPEQVTFTAEQIKDLDEVWNDINRTLGRENFAVRVFGAPAMLSNLKATADGRKLALYLVNYSDYPVEAITVHTLGKYSKASLLAPDGNPEVELFDYEDGSGADIREVTDVAILVLER